MAFKEFLENELTAISKKETKESLGDRSAYIGASDISGCLLNAYYSKKEEVEHNLEKLLIFERGHIAESIIEKALNNKGLNYKSQYEIADEIAGFPVKAHLDFVIEGKKEAIVLEVKTTNRVLEAPYSSWLLQINFQMGLLKKAINKNVRGYILVFDLNKGQFMEFPAEFDEAMFDIAYQKAQTLAKALLENEAPDPEEQLYCSQCPFKDKCPLFNEVEEEINNDEIVYSVELLKSLEAQKKELDNQIKAVKNELEEFFREKGIKKAKVSNYLVSLSADSAYETIDLTLLKKEDPETYNQLLEKFKKVINRKGSLKIK